MDMFLLVVTVISLCRLRDERAAWRMARVERREAPRAWRPCAARGRDVGRRLRPNTPSRGARGACEPRDARAIVSRAGRDPRTGHHRRGRRRRRRRSTAPWAPARVSLFPLDGPDARASGRRIACATAGCSGESASDAHATMSDGFLGSSVTAPRSGGRQRGLAIAACVLFVAIVTGGYFTIFGGRHTASALRPARTARQRRSSSCRCATNVRARALSITGLVRNPVKRRRGRTISPPWCFFSISGARSSRARAPTSI